MQNIWVHIIGIAGVTTSAVAVMFKRHGFKVTGTDKGFYPPVSTYLKKSNVRVLPGFKSERLTDNNGRHPDLVVYQGTKGSNNPEIKEAKKLNLKLITFPEVLEKYVVNRDMSVVVAGTYGKTTITAALVSMLLKASVRASYMIGGISMDIPHSIAAKEEASQLSVIEGDEFITSLSDRQSKFFYYHPTHLVLNSISWEHPDVFLSEREYIKNFRKLVNMLPRQGLLVANANDRNVVDVADDAKCEVVYYSQDPKLSITTPQWIINKESRPLPTIERLPGVQTLEAIPYEKQIIGDFNEENLLAAAVMAYELGVDRKAIQSGIKEFHGIERRLQVRYKRKNVMVIDDFGSSPPKAKGALSALDKDFPKAKIIAVFEPNASNRVARALPLFNDALKEADIVYLPRFTKLPRTVEERFDADTLAKKLAESGHKVFLMEDDSTLVSTLLEDIHAGMNEQVIICFLGSHSFRGMIADLINKLNDG